MTKQEFIDEIKDILEVNELFAEQNLTDMDEFDSLAVMSIGALLFAKFNKKLSGYQIKSVKTVNELIALVGNDNFTS